MIVAILAQALAAEAPALNLNLACEGQYEDTEVTRETVGAVTRDGYRTASGTSVTGIKRTGVGYATFSGSTGQITYPGGVRRELSNVVASEQEITATYQRKAMLVTHTYKVEINRVTGAIRVARGGAVGFAGTCTPVSTTPKF